MLRIDWGSAELRRPSQKSLSQIYFNDLTGSANNKSYNYRDENTIAELSSSYNSIHFVKGVHP